jgi:hypothetical protein
VFDITDTDSFNRVKKWVRELKKMAGKDIVLVVAGNKVDRCALPSQCRGRVRASGWPSAAVGSSPLWSDMCPPQVSCSAKAAPLLRQMSRRTRCLRVPQHIIRCLPFRIWVTERRRAAPVPRDVVTGTRSTCTIIYSCRTTTFPPPTTPGADRARLRRTGLPQLGAL